MTKETWIAKIKEIGCWTEELITFCPFSPISVWSKKLPNFAVKHVDLSFFFLFFHVYCPVLHIITIQYIKGIIKYRDIQLQLFTKGHKSHKNQGIPKETNPHPAHI